MRRIVPALAVALAVPAAVAAAPTPVTSTIAASPTEVTYMGAVTISGTASSQKAGEKVTVQAQTCGQNAFRTGASVMTAAGGTWTTSLRPTANTQYRAKIKNFTSTAVSVGVHPAVRLTKVARRKYRVRVSAAQSFAGKVVTFQRFKAATGRWVTVRRATLRQISAGPTVVSGITFRSRIGAGRRVRVVLPKLQAAPCYLAGVSNVIRS